MVSYNPLWKLLIDKGIRKEDLRQMIDVSSSTIAKMGKGEYIALQVVEKICLALGCRIEDVIEIRND